MEVVVDDGHVAVFKGQVLVLRSLDQETSQFACAVIAWRLMGSFLDRCALSWGLNNMVEV